MRLSERGRSLIQSFEGLKLRAYLDPVGIWTIGYGHTLTAEEGQVITSDEAQRLFDMDVAEFEHCVARAVTVPLSAHEFDALVSFAYNVGCGALRESTLLRKLNAGDRVGAGNEFKRWTKAGGRELRGLVRRRQAEADLFRGRM